MTDLLAQHVNEILEFFKQRTGCPHWIGTVGIGICVSGKEYLDEPAFAVMLGEFHEESFHVFSGIRSANDVSVARLKCGERDANFAIVHADPRNSEIGCALNPISPK